MENDKADTVSAIIGTLAIALNIICGILECLGISTGTFGGLVAATIPCIIIATLIFLAHNAISTNKWESTYTVLGIAAFIWANIAWAYFTR